jgi:hypothetical protein
VRRIIVLISGLAISLLATQWTYASDVDIEYALTNLGGNHWQYTYDVTNNALVAKVQEFTIWFQLGSYTNLSITTANPPSSLWDEFMQNPDPIISEDGFYDALTKSTGIDVGQSVQGFSVAFDWLGTGTPGPQGFQVVNPVTFQILFSGMTVPEPATAFLMMGAGLILCCRRWH